MTGIIHFYHMQRKLYILFLKSNMIFMEMTCLLRQNEGIDRQGTWYNL